MKNTAFPSCMKGVHLDMITLDGDDSYCLDTINSLHLELSSRVFEDSRKPCIIVMEAKSESYESGLDSCDCSTRIEMNAYELKIPKLTTAQREVLALFVKKSIVHSSEVPRNRVNSMQVLQQMGLVRAIANKGTELHMNNYARKLLIAHYFGP